MGKEEEKAAVYSNRRRIRGARGKRLLRQRGELVERCFAHMYETGGMRRTHLRFHENIIKRLLIHAGAFNLSLVMRKLSGRGTPRGFHGHMLGFVLSLQMILLAFRKLAISQFGLPVAREVTSREVVAPFRIHELCSNPGLRFPEIYCASGC
jgi:hypothetical protein